MEKGKDNNDDVTLELDKIEEYAYEIYSELVDKEELSLYRSKLYGKKIEILNNCLQEHINKQFAMMKKNEEATKAKKLSSKLSIASYFYFFLAVINPYLWIILFLITFIYKLILFSRMKEVKIDSKVLEQIKELETTLENCEMFITSKQSKREERIKKEKTNNSEVALELNANDIFQNYLNNSLPLENFSICNDQIRETLIQILQKDLSANISDLNQLLLMAKQKISTENLEAELKLTRKKAKNGEN